MGMFNVKKGTACKVKIANVDYTPENIRDFETTKDSLFGKEEVVLDPVGKLGCSEAYSTVGHRLEKAGFFAFQRRGGKYVLMVPMKDVKYV